MVLFKNIGFALGGITLFLLGLKFMSESMEELTGNKMKALLRGLTSNKVAGVITGAVSTAVIQSSVATNVILVGLTSSGILTFYQASSVIMGANIGTTITAQLISLSGKQFFDITSIGAFVMFIGFILGFLSNKTVKNIGKVMLGFGMLFLGIDVINSSVNYFKNYQEFRNIFLVDSDILLFLNGFIITAICSSSSAVTSVMIVLASNELLDFGSAVFLILGANVGTCISVIIASLNKPIEARRSAFFNFAFNLFGALIWFLPLSILKPQVVNFFFTFSSGVERAIANFHTLFNLVVTLTLIPILKPFTNLIEKIITDKKPKRAVEKAEKLVKIKI